MWYRVALVLALSVVLYPPRVWAAPTMPLGIPDPGPWAWTSASPRPDPWTAQVTGYYYIDSSTGIDTNNAYGWPEKPRATIPLSLPAGSVVEIHGTYAKRHSGNGQEIRSLGTEAQPVFIRGQEDAIPTLTGMWGVWGEWLFMENLRFALDPSYNASKLNRCLFLQPRTTTVDLDHIAIRNVEFTGGTSSGAVQLDAKITNTAPAVSRDIVFYRVHSHHNGGAPLASPTDDQDLHGITMNARLHNVWVLDSEFDHNSGDGIQINGGANNQANLTNIYLGRNNSHHNKQYGFWVKEAQDVIISENKLHDLIDSNSSTGACAGTHYSTQKTWFLFNECYGTERGFRGSTENDGVGTIKPSDRYYIGNIIHDIHRVTRTADGSIPVGAPNDEGQEAAFSLASDGPATWHIINNTVYNVDAGVYIWNPAAPPSNPKLIMRNNIWGAIDRSRGTQINIKSGPNGAATAAASTVTNDVFFENGGAAGFRWGDGVTRTFTDWMTKFAVCTGCKSADPGLIGPSTQATQWQPASVLRDDLGALQAPYVTWATSSSQNYRLAQGSACIDAGGAVPDEYAVFKSLYGIDIAQDLDHRLRPQGQAMDVGSYEFTSGAIPCK